MAIGSAEVMKVFICYAREDESLLHILEKHLWPLRRQGLIEPWYDQEITAGSEWEAEIKKQLDAADIILLLVSPDFMASEYCYSKEMTRAMERQERGEAHVIPVILRHIYWKGEPFSKLQALPTDAKPVTDRFWHNPDEAFLSVAEGLSGTIEQVRRSREEQARKADEEARQKADKELALRTFELGTNYLNQNNYPDHLWHNLNNVFRSVAEELSQTIEQMQQSREEQARKADEEARQKANEEARQKELALKAFEIGAKYLDQNNYNEAQLAFEQASSLDPTNADFHDYRTHTYYRLGNYEESLGAIEQAIRLDPNNSLYFMIKGSIHEQLEQYDKALAAYEQSLIINPKPGMYKNYEAWKEISAVLLKLGKVQESQQAQEKAEQSEAIWRKKVKNMP